VQFINQNLSETTRKHRSPSIALIYSDFSLAPSLPRVWTVRIAAAAAAAAATTATTATTAETV